MSLMTIHDLMRILRECAGAGADIETGGEILDLRFDDLGYDSLALLETLSRIEHDYGTRLPEEFVEHARTPRALLATVNETLVRAG
ncbi:acyl carrier protein [Streptomyces iconiensis]|uniref:Acyl carrier protein n=1 Tax=Streptomyces iconiensis TaxID=1384038 RepID=A0ABT7A6E1_9ACTN|nr:acyl carrier protein [Streptomyces iconiensis]MDJ1136900.1 acyl carrier protein [Streptomyces iconiensis]